MYIFHPMFCNPMGIMKTKTSLDVRSVSHMYLVYLSWDGGKGS